MVKQESIEFTNNHGTVNRTIVTASMSHSVLTKRSRKAVHPSRPTNQSIPAPYYNQPESYLQSNRTDEQENCYESSMDTDEASSITLQHEMSKRPRLSYSRRLQANARERERVHNLTAAFEALRQVIPMYYGQPKLSRLSILRIACSYVLVLGALNEIDFSEGQYAYTLNESFHLLSSTILNELKRKKPTNNKND